MSFFEIQAWSAIGLAVLMTGAWLVSLRLRDASIVDVIWGPAFMGVAWLAHALGPGGSGLRGLMLVAVVSAWALRLSTHVYLRNRGKPEDPRYAKWRRESGSRWWWRSLLTVFLLQGALVWIIAAPLVAGQLAAAPDRWPPLLWIGFACVLVGFFFEAVGDWQLAMFLREPGNAGRLMTTGLWSYTRHPNYFGDALQWWGFFLIAAAGGAWWTIFSPLLMTFLIVRVSGVALLERGQIARRPGFAEYQASTSAFIPWPPRQRA